MHWTTRSRMAAAIAVTILLAACANHGDTGAKFGDSVRHMTEKQIYNLEAAHNPDPEPLEGGNVDRLNGVLDSHRNNAEDPTEDRGALVMHPFN